MSKVDTIEYSELPDLAWGFLAAIRCWQSFILHAQYQLDFFYSSQPLPPRYHWQQPFECSHYEEKLNNAIASHDEIVAAYEQEFGPVPDIKDALHWRNEQQWKEKQ